MKHSLERPVYTKTTVLKKGHYESPVIHHRSLVCVTKELLYILQCDTPYVYLSFIRV